MKLNLYKCSAKDREWYSLANEICKGAIPLDCGTGFLGNTIEVPPEKIEFLKEVEIDITSFLENEIATIKQNNAILISELAEKTAELEEYRQIGWRMYFK
jgi:hypothetical protein